MREALSSDGAPVQVDPVQHHRARVALGATRRSQRGLQDRLLAAEHALEAALAIQAAPTPTPTIVAPKRTSKGKRVGSAIVLCSDWHVEEHVDPRKVRGRNRYGLEVAAERIDRLTVGTIRLLETQAETWDLRELVLWLGGDLMGGYIHPELIESNEASPIETVLWLRSKVTRMIRSILESGAVRKIVVPCNYGNHGRTPDQRRPKIATQAANNFEWLLYQVLAKDFENEKRVHFHVSETDVLYLRAYDFTLRFTHGDAVKYNGGVGGVTIPLLKAISAWDTDQRADYTFLGHYHQWLPHGRFLINGSLIGWSDVAVRFKCTYEPARQAFAILDAEEGMTALHPIWVQLRSETVPTEVSL